MISAIISLCWSWLPSVLFTAFLYFATLKLWKYYVLSSANDPHSKVSKNIPIPPGDFGIPILGETISWAVQGQKFNTIRREKYGNVFSTHLIGEPGVRVSGPEMIRELLAGEHTTIAAKMPASARALLGTENIIQSSGAVHKRRKAAVLKAFSHSALENYIPTLTEQIKRQVSQWSEAKRNHMVYHDLKSMAYDVAFKIFLGIKIENSEEHSGIKSNTKLFMDNLFSMPYKWLGMGFKKGMDARTNLHRILDGYIAKKKKLLQNVDLQRRKNENKDALQFMIEENIKEIQRQKMAAVESDSSDLFDDRGNGESAYLSEQELRETCVELVAAGSQTNSSLMSSLLYQLAQHPEVVAKLEEELELHGILALHGDEAYMTGGETEDEDEQKITMKTLNKLSYMDQVVKETLRLMSPIPGAFRKALKTFQLGKYRIPKGWTIVYNISETHLMWEDGKSFNPDRFANWSQSKADNKYKWIAFGGGKRRCVANKYTHVACKIFLIEVLKKFKSWEFSSGKPSPMFMIPVLHPTDGMPMRFHVR